MKRTLMFAALSAASIFAAQIASAATFSYHGVLQDAGKPAHGTYDIELTLYSAPSGGNVVGGPLTLYGVSVNDGSFSTDADFGPLASSFKQAYVGVKVRSAGVGDFTPLVDRTSVTDTNTSCPGSWSLDGNAGNPAGSFLGTTDSSDLVLKSHNTQVATAYVTTAGPYPSWAGGALNFIDGQGVFIGGGGASGPTDSANANSAYGFGVVGGGQKNKAGATGVTFATVGGGQSNTASSNFSTIGGGQNNSATAVGATVAGGQTNLAGGVDSFAAGNGAIVANAHSFVWSDGAALFGDSGPAEFDIQAAGGAAINGNPENSGIELSIFPSSANGGDFSNIYFGLTGAGGILTSAGNASSSTSNDASFFFDDYDGTHQTRIFTIAPIGITVGGSVNESVVSLLPNGATAKIVMDAHGSSQADMGFEIAQVPTGSGSTVSFMNFGAAGQLQIFNATAEKPGGGTWTATSDRRIKQDIEPIHDAVDTLMKLRPVNFRYTPEYRAMEGGLADKSYAGFVAQEYAEVFPSDVVNTTKHVPGADKNDPTILALDPNPALITTVAAVQELAIENSTLRKEVEELEARLTKLESAKGK
jgi:hypothetical protein